MDKSNTVSKKNNISEIFKFISTIISWTVFVLLFICLILLLYYFISLKLYGAKGDKYEPAFSLYTIVSPSMVPNINVYDVIVNTKINTPDDIQIGDVITFISQSDESKDKTVTHRVVAINKDIDGNISYQTKGDNNLIPDSAEAPYDKVIGKVSLKIPQLGRAQFFLASKFGWITLIFLPACYILINDLIKLIKKYLSLTNIDLNKYGWFRKLNIPILPYQKRKLLPEPKYVPALVGINDNVDIEFNKDNINDFTQVDLPVLDDNYIKENINNNEIDDDIEIDDMPILK